MHDDAIPLVPDVLDELSVISTNPAQKSGVIGGVEVL
jgi:hypothetical protein